MTIKCCLSFFPALHSLEYNNVQWLENSFPIAKTKSWYNPWCGGISTKPENLSMKSVLLEDVEAEFTKLKDSCGNEWEGIKTKISLNHDEKYKVLELNEYYLMLKGVPVFYIFTDEYIDELCLRDLRNVHFGGK